MAKKIQQVKFTCPIFVHMLIIIVAMLSSMVCLNIPNACADNVTAASGSESKKANDVPAKDKPAEASLTQAQLWALACPALLTVSNRERHDLLWCLPATPENVAKEKTL